MAEPVRMNESSGGPARIDRGLEGGEQLRHALHFVKNRAPRDPRHEADGVGDGCRPYRLIVERQVAVTARLADGVGERRLSALPRAVNQDGRRVSQCLPEAWREAASLRRDGPGHGRMIGRLPG